MKDARNIDSNEPVQVRCPESHVLRRPSLTPPIDLTIFPVPSRHLCLFPNKRRPLLPLLLLPPDNNKTKQAYADYEDLMSMTEQMISGMVQKICGSFKIKYQLNPGEDPLEVDFTPPFRRVSMMDGLEEVLKVKLPALDDPEVGVAYTL